jgi:hypothetical protein
MASVVRFAVHRARSVVAASAIVACVVAVGLVGAGAVQAREPALCNGVLATVVGSSGPDVLRGTPADDVIAGLDGPDVVSGLGGDDVICGGAGPDVLRGDGGADLLIGAGGPDVAVGGGGPDNCSAEIARCENSGDAPAVINLRLELQGDQFNSPSIFNQYVYLITNEGAPRTGNVVVTDTLPAGIRFLSVSSPGDFWDCTGTAPPGRQTVTCQYELENVVDQVGFTLTVAADLPTPTSVVNTACITAPVDSNPDDNCSTVTTQVVATPPPP